MTREGVSSQEFSRRVGRPEAVVNGWLSGRGHLVAADLRGILETIAQP